MQRERVKCLCNLQQVTYTETPIQLSFNGNFLVLGSRLEAFCLESSTQNLRAGFSANAKMTVVDRISAIEPLQRLFVVAMYLIALALT